MSPKIILFLLAFDVIDMLMRNLNMDNVLIFVSAADAWRSDTSAH